MKNTEVVTGVDNHNFEISAFLNLTRSLVPKAKIALVSCDILGWVNGERERGLRSRGKLI